VGRDGRAVLDLVPAHVSGREVVIDLDVVGLPDVEPGVVRARRERVVNAPRAHVRREDPVLEVVLRGHVRDAPVVDAEEEHAVAFEPVDLDVRDQRPIDSLALVCETARVASEADRDSLVLVASRLEDDRSVLLRATDEGDVVLGDHQPTIARLGATSSSTLAINTGKDEDPISRMGLVDRPLDGLAAMDGQRAGARGGGYEQPDGEPGEQQKRDTPTHIDPLLGI
jgi:hypothetical protein